MGQSLYFTATRSETLTDDERSAIAVLVEEFSVEDQIDRFLSGGDGLNWESFTWREGTDEKVFTGSVRLPDVTLKAIFTGIEHWGRLLGRVRVEVLPGAVWVVDVEGDVLPWLDDQERFWDSSVDDYDLDAMEDLI